MIFESFKRFKKDLCERFSHSWILGGKKDKVVEVKDRNRKSGHRES